MYSLHYDELDEVLGIKAVTTMPGALQAGSPASECSTPGSTSVNRKRETCRWQQWLEERLPRVQQLQMIEATKNTTRKRVSEQEEEGVSPLQQRLLEMQERQMEMFASAERRTKTCW